MGNPFAAAATLALMAQFRLGGERVAGGHPAAGHPEGKVMYHTIELVADLWVDGETSPGHHLERVLRRRGTRLSAQLRPYVIWGRWGPVEVADLFFADGTSARGVRYAYFAFTDDLASGTPANGTRDSALSDPCPRPRSPLWQGVVAGATRGALVGVSVAAVGGGLLLGTLEPLLASCGLPGCLGPVLTLVLAVALEGVLAVGSLGLAGAAVGAVAVALRMK